VPMDSHNSGLADIDEDNPKKHGDSDAERDLQKRITQSAEELRIDCPGIGASSANRPRVSASAPSARR